MRITGFNPINKFITIWEATALHLDENVVRNIAFVALSKCKPQELAAGLDENFSAKVMAYAEDRSSKITQAIQALNELCQQKAHLASTESYLKVKQADRELEQAYTELCNLSSEIATGVLKDMTSSITAKKTQHKLSRIQERVHAAFGQPIQNGRPKIWAWAIKEINKQPDLHAQAARLMPMLGFEEGVPVGPLRCAMQGILQTQLMQHLENLMGAMNQVNMGHHVVAFVDAHKDYQSEAAYVRHAKQKEIVRRALTELATFCSLDELTAHPEITALAKEKLLKIANVQ